MENHKIHVPNHQPDRDEKQDFSWDLIGFSGLSGVEWDSHSDFMVI